MAKGNSRTTALLNRGISSHNSGDIPAARDYYRKVLLLDPKQADAHHLLGVSEYQSGNNEQAIRKILRAIALKPGISIYYQNLGNAYFSAADYSEALKSYRLAVRLEPDNADIKYNLGRAFQRLNCYPEALENYTITLKNQPDHFWATHYSGEICQELERYPEAILFYNRVIEMQPDFADAYHRLGIVYQLTNDFSTALINLEKAQMFDPDNPVLLARTGILLQNMNRLDEAVDIYQQAIKLKPDYHEVLGNLGGVYRELGNFSSGLKMVERALDFEPGNPVYLNNYGNLLLKLNRFAEAKSTFQQVLKIDPDFNMAYVNMSAVCLADHDLNGAVKYNHQALSKYPEDIHANWNQALLDLYSGKLKRGFEAYEWRWQKSDFKNIKRNYTQPVWDGKPHLNSTLFIWAEQGFGDTIQFIRFISQVKLFFKKVVVEVQPPLVALIQSMSEIDRVIEAGSEFDDFDYQIPLLSIPRYFLSDSGSIPTTIPYIATTSGNTELEAAPIKNSNGYKIGISWAGSPSHENDHNRSIPLSMFKPLEDNDGIRLFSLQLGSRRADLKDMPGSSKIYDMGDHLTDFMATAQLMNKLDLIITVDTAVAHLAGALGHKVWVLLPYQSDWRWLFEREDSPWYPTMRLFRQSRDCQWEPVIQSVIESLRQEF